VPALINPPNVALITDDTPTFDWSGTAGTGGLYTLEYALDAGFTTGVVTVTGLSDTTYTVPGLESLSDDTYYWHVEAFDAASNGSGYQTVPFSFTVDAGAPAVPTLINPPDLSVTYNDKPTFDWTATAGSGGSYTLQYAVDAAFTSGVVTVSGLVANTYTVPPLLPGGVGLLDNTYYWRVEAFDVASNGSGYQATPFSFTVDTEAPDVPTLINPPDQTIVNVDRPTFDWSATAGPGGTYTLEYATDSLFLFVVTVSGLTSPTYTPTSSLANRDFYWHVNAIDEATNESGYQAHPFMFTVDLDGLPVPTLLTPPDQSFTCDTTPTFTWAPVAPVATSTAGTRGDMSAAGAAPAAITYTLQYSSDPLFADATTVSGIAAPTYTVSELAPITFETCYWRVEAEDDGGQNSGYQAQPFQFGLFVAGDQNEDDVVTASDVIYLVNYVFKSGGTPRPCEAAGDVNCDGAVSASDIIYLVNYTFKAGPAPCNVGNLIAAGTWSCP
jgi:hypothetical protein